MQQIKVTPKDLDPKIEAICAKDEFSIMSLQRALGLGFGAAGYVTDGAREQGLIEDISNEHFQYKFKILDPNGLKAYLRVTLTRPIPKSQFQA